MTTKTKVSIIIILGLALLAREGVSITLAPKFQSKEETPRTYQSESTGNSQPAAIGEHSMADRPDDFPGMYQFHLLYVIPKDFKLSTKDLDGSIDASIIQMNDWFLEQTGGSTLRFDTFHGKLDITYVILPVTDTEFLSYTREIYGRKDQEFDGLIYLNNALEDFLEKMDTGLKIMTPGKIYIAYFEISKSFVCGHAPVTGNRVIGLYPSAVNLRDSSQCAAFLGKSDKTKRGVWEQLILHEIIHSLGFPTACASHLVNNDVHIDDPEYPNDIMSEMYGMYDQNPVLDPNHDDYYNTNFECGDLAESPFLNPLPVNSALPGNVLSNPFWRLPK